jgi:hypothetical protein
LWSIFEEAVINAGPYFERIREFFVSAHFCSLLAWALFYMVTKDLTVGLLAAVWMLLAFIVVYIWEVWYVVTGKDIG